MAETADWPRRFDQGAIITRSPKITIESATLRSVPLCLLLFSIHSEFEKMRTLAIGVLALGLIMAFASAVFIWSGRTCSIGTGFCHHPLLLFVPVLATLAWGLMLRLNE